MKLIGVAVAIAQGVMIVVSLFFWTAVTDTGDASEGALVLLAVGAVCVFGAIAGGVTPALVRRSEWWMFVVPGVFATVTSAGAWCFLYIVHSFDCMLAAETFNCRPPASDKVAILFGLEIGIVVYAAAAALVHNRPPSAAGASR